MQDLNYVLAVVVTVLLWVHGIIVIGGSVTVAVAYYKSKDGRLLHIVYVATAHAIFSVMAITAIINNLRSVNSVRGFCTLAAFILTNMGLSQIFFNSLPRLFPNRFKNKGNS